MLQNLLFCLSLLGLSASIVLDSSSGVHYPPPPPSPRDIGTSPRGVHLPLGGLSDRQHHPDLEVRQAWLRSESINLRRKYAQHLDPEARDTLRRDTDAEERRRSLYETNLKRASGSTGLIDVGIDASYGAQVSIGTPAQNFYLVLDTGSADLWVAGAECTSSSCTGTTRFTESSSSTYSASSAAFDITYGSGDAEGFVAQDTVGVAGLTVTGQTIAIVNRTSTNLISAPLSGILGLAWQRVAQTNALPWWQALMQSNQIDSPVMAFFMQRWRGVRGVSQLEQNGGEFSFGTLNSSRYTGNINYIAMTGSSQDYWRIPAQALNIQNQSVTINSPQVAIDTGTTLIGVPSATAASIYAKIPGSSQLTGSYAGYYQYPCSTVITSSIQFGGLSYSITNADFNIGSFTRDTTQCTGAFFALNLGSSSTISWIAGASFLKNVYSIFRYNPPSIGFAALSSQAGTVSNGTTATTNSTGTGTGGTSGSGSNSGSGSSSGNGAGSLSATTIPTIVLVFTATIFALFA